MPNIKHHAYRLLKWSEQYTRTDMKYLAKSSFWMGSKYIVGILTGLATTVAFANWIDPTTYGTFQFVISVGAIIGAFSLTGMAKALNRATAQGREGALRYAVVTKLKWSIGIVLAGGAIAIYYFINENYALGIAILLAGALQPITLSFRIYENYLGGKKLFKHDAIIELLRKLFPFTALLTTLYYSNSVVLLAAVYFGSNAISYILGYMFVLWYYRPPYQPDPDAFYFSKHLSGMALVGQLGAHADKLLLWHFLGPAAVATFTVAQFATRYSGNLLNIITQIAVPKFSVRDLPTLQQTLPRKVLLFSGVTALVAILYVMVAPLLFHWLFPTYTDAIALTQVLALTLLFLPRSLYGQALTAHARTRELYTLSFATPVIKVSLFLLLIPFYGIWGAVYATLAHGMINSILVFILFKRTK